MTSLFPALPVFMDLVGRSVVFCTGDDTAARLARDCLHAGAGVVAIDPQPGAAMRALSPAVRLLERRWKALDFRNAALVVVGFGERRPGQARASAKAAKAMFMTLDGAPGADVAPGATTARGPLTIGVSTSGISEALAQLVRDRIEALAPARLTPFLEAAASAGGALDFPDPGRRRRFWEAALGEALETADHRDRTAWDAWLAARHADFV